MPKIHIITVLHTSANDLDTGDIVFDTKTAKGTAIDIESTNPIFNISRKLFCERSLKY